MCVTVVQHFDGCDCTITRNLICADHVNHTRKQIDNKLCPKNQIRYVEMEGGGCSSNNGCKKREGNVWVFDHFSPSQGDFTFLEHPRYYYDYPKCLERGHFTRNHKCGIGKTVDGHWRHLDKGGFPMEVVSGTKKSEVKREDEDVAVKEEDVMIKEEDVDMQG
ncbi:hypothetical protein N431DRAFT_461421 [Stipitochalara longipes BDJ]|nr:hypothetical protein N431DRAFT_461421 [Stipitochalara longipes BDJ]